MTPKDAFATHRLPHIRLWLSLLALPVGAPAGPAAAQTGLPQITVPRDLDAARVEPFADKLDVNAIVLAGTSRTLITLDSSLSYLSTAIAMLADAARDGQR